MRSSTVVRKSLLWIILQDMKQQHLEKGDSLTSDEERIVDRYLLEFKHQGYHLEEKKFSELTETWNKKVADNMAEYKFRITVSHSTKLT